LLSRARVHGAEHGFGHTAPERHPLKQFGLVWGKAGGTRGDDRGDGDEGSSRGSTGSRGWSPGRSSSSSATSGGDGQLLTSTTSGGSTTGASGGGTTGDGAGDSCSHPSCGTPKLHLKVNPESDEEVCVNREGKGRVKLEVGVENRGDSKLEDILVFGGKGHEGELICEESRGECDYREDTPGNRRDCHFALSPGDNWGCTLHTEVQGEGNPYRSRVSAEAHDRCGDKVREKAHFEVRTTTDCECDGDHHDGDEHDRCDLGCCGCCAPPILDGDGGPTRTLGALRGDLGSCCGGCMPPVLDGDGGLVIIRSPTGGDDGLGSCCGCCMPPVLDGDGGLVIIRSPTGGGSGDDGLGSCCGCCMPPVLDGDGGLVIIRSPTGGGSGGDGLGSCCGCCAPPVLDGNGGDLLRGPVGGGDGLEPGCGCCVPELVGGLRLGARDVVGGCGVCAPPEEPIETRSVSMDGDTEDGRDCHPRHHKHHRRGQCCPRVCVPRVCGGSTGTSGSSGSTGSIGTSGSSGSTGSIGSSGSTGELTTGTSGSSGSSGSTGSTGTDASTTTLTSNIQVVDVVISPAFCAPG